jgi:hypothetical protein
MYVCIYQLWTVYEVNMLYMDLLGLYWPKIYVMYYSCQWNEHFYLIWFENIANVKISWCLFVIAGYWTKLSQYSIWTFLIMIMKKNMHFTGVCNILFSLTNLLWCCKVSSVLWFRNRWYDFTFFLYALRREKMLSGLAR